MMFLTKGEPLSIAMGPVRYKKLPGGHVSAIFIVTNTSRVTIQYMQFYGAKIRIDGTNGWRESPIPPSPILEAPTRIEPRKTSTNRVILPPDVRHWQVGYSAHSPSARARLFRILPRKISARFADVISQWISDERANSELVWGETVDAASWIEAHPGEPMLLQVPFREVFAPQQN